jgi:hypothetical protein
MPIALKLSMTASVEEIQSIPHLLKAVVLLMVTTIVLFIWLAFPRHNVEAGGTQTSTESSSLRDGPAAPMGDKISPFGPPRVR